MNVLFQPCLFFLSFLPLWVSVAFIDGISIWESKSNLWTEHISLALIGVCTLLSILVVVHQMRKWAPSDCVKPTVKTAAKQRAVTAEYLLSYILPLFAFDFTQWRQVVLFLIFFATLSYLCLKHHYVYANIILELRGYTCYDCTLVMPDGGEFGAVVISKEELTGSLNCRICYKGLGGGYGLGLKPTA